MPTKICTRCKNDKDLKEFPNDKRRRDGKGSWCRECERERNRLRIKNKSAKAYRRRNQGLCVTCGKPSNGKWRCPKCAKANNKATQQWLKNDPRRYIIQNARQRAREQNIEFDLSYKDFELPKHCPALGIKLKRGDYDAAPSLDRIIPSRGYIRGNVKVISYRANRIKSNATAEELRKVADYIDRNT